MKTGVNQTDSRPADLFVSSGGRTWFSWTGHVCCPFLRLSEVVWVGRGPNEPRINYDRSGVASVKLGIGDNNLTTT